jgi:hypothetical protein
MTIRDPVLTPVAVGDLRPTQLTVGMREVQAKRKRWREMHKDAAEFLGKHMIPVPWPEASALRHRSSPSCARPA